MRALVIEDHAKMGQAIQSGMRSHGFEVDLAASGADGEDAAAASEYDLIVLDLMLPDRDGVEVCRNLRRRGVKSRVLMLTALGAMHDKVQGLDAGADDYLTKPFEFDELLARARALMRRGDASESRVLRHEDLELDLYTRAARRGGAVVELSNREFSLLELMMRNPNRVLTRTMIGERVWDMDIDPTTNVIDVYVSSLRKKLDRGHARELVHTVRGAGYRFGALEAV